MALEDKKRGSIALPTIEESDEDLDLVEDILRISRKKKECRTPSKRSSSEKSKSKAAELSARKRTPRHCAEQAREKITTLFNQGDKHGRSIYAVSESGSSEDSCEAFQPIDEEDVMPKGEYGASSEDEEIVNKGSELFNFGWKTPKRKSTLRTPLKTPTSVAKQRLIKTPNKTPLKTPDRRKSVAAQTPQTVRRQLRNKIVKVTSQVLEGVSDAESDGSESESSSDCDEEERKEMKKKAAKNQSMDITVNTEDYFLAQMSSVHTSDRTLNRLANPRLSQEAVDSLMENYDDCHSKEKLFLMKEYQDQFLQWSFLLREGFNILVYGLGSKRYLLDDFRTRCLNGKDVLVVNGYFPGLTMKEILNSLTDGILENSGSFSGPVEQLEFIEQEFASSRAEAYIILHNMDGPSLQFGKEQETLCRLAAIPGLNVIASTDHINTPLLWDQRKLSQAKFVFYDCTTFAPYNEEISYENSLLVQQSSTLGLASLVHVFASLTYNAKAIFILIAERQLEHRNDSNYHGFPFHELYSDCRDKMLVNSDLTLRAQLTEFKDHKLLRIRRSPDGTEVLHIPLENNQLEEFIQKHREQ
uniref:Origin recognition complex subunit 2 n=1 Tax=Scapholeberis mucronata TaxID=202097 RepID=A0A4Y7NKN1_9CRUS|nr:EOG090X0AVI [Scapholeberis mucronata]SVE93801.1 EOG090X0AVI [Scapholeberis mucronata]